MAIIEGIDDEVLLSIGTIAVFCGAVILWTVKSSTNNRFTVQISPNTDQTRHVNDISNITQRPLADHHQADISHETDHDQSQENNFPASSHQTLPTFTQGTSCTTSSSHDINTHHHDETTSDDDPSAATSNLRNRSNQQTDNDSDQTWTIKIILLDRDMRTVCVSPTSTIQQLKQTAFPQELANGTAIRLVYAGRELRDNNKTLVACNITNHSNVHAVLNVRQNQQAQPGQQQHQPQEESQELDLSKLFVPLLVAFIAFMWIIFFLNMEHFSNKAVIFLLAVSVVIMVTLVGTSGRVNVS